MTALVVARDADDFRAAPLGRCCIGRTFVVWCAAPDLTGTILWGAPDERDARDLVATMEFVHHADLAPERCAIMDGRAIERIDGDALLTFTRLARAHMTRWSPRTRREAIVVPDGLRGMLLAGAMTALAPAHPVRIVDDLGGALAFLDHPGAAAAHAAAATHAATARGNALLVGRLRLVLAHRLNDASVEACASTLGLSSRTLQRELHRLGTSFSDELRRARVAAAEELLRLTDAKIESIACRVGLGSASRMSAALRRELRVTASELRARSRAPLAFARAG